MAAGTLFFERTPVIDAAVVEEWPPRVTMAATAMAATAAIDATTIAVRWWPVCFGSLRSSSGMAGCYDSKAQGRAGDWQAAAITDPGSYAL